MTATEGPMPAGDRCDVAVIGAGVVGTAIARRLSHFSLRTVLLDAARDVGSSTSKANTAILHTGFDATPGTIEARLVSEGFRLLRAHAARVGIAIERTGALLVAWDDEQLDSLDGLQRKAERNGVRSCRRIGFDELRRLEPHLGPAARGALAVPDEAIIDPWAPPLAFTYEAMANGAEIRLDTRVTGLAPEPDGWAISTTTGTGLRARFVVNAAGLQSDVVDRLAGHDRFTVTPRRGELIVFDKLARGLLHHILLPVPTKMGKGVLVSPTVFGNVLLGPTAENIDDRTATASTHDGLTGLLDKGRAILPALVDEAVTAVYAGLRAATEHVDYQLHRDGTYVCVGGIRSTGLTASMALADEVLGQLSDAGCPLVEKPSVSEVHLTNLGEAFPRPYQDGAAIAADPERGRIVCHCERVTRAELVAACRAPVPASDLDGLRRRTRVLTGRCQGFFCGAAVASLLATERGCTIADVLEVPGR